MDLSFGGNGCVAVPIAGRKSPARGTASRSLGGCFTQQVHGCDRDEKIRKPCREYRRQDTAGPDRFGELDISSTMKVVARLAATPHAAPLLGVEIASGAPNNAVNRQMHGMAILSASSTCSFLALEPLRASASM